jgi:hypothetical protein
MDEITVLCKHCGDRIRSNTANELLHCKCMKVYVRGDTKMFRLKHCSVNDFILILKNPKEYEAV